nr:carbon storage regulator [Azotobacter chroococcum]
MIGTMTGYRAKACADSHSVDSSLPAEQGQGVDHEKLLQHLLHDGITLHFGRIDCGRVSIDIEAPREVLALRDELADAVSLF